MKKNSSTIFKLIAITQILALSFLAACSTVGGALGADATSTNACRATGDPANPYEEVTITNDIFPVPVNGCPAGPVLVSDGKITICHATGSETNPYNEMTVSVNGLNGHGAHENDVFPASEGACPASGPAASNSEGGISPTVCHATGDESNPYEEINVNEAELQEHTEHDEDLNPAPANGCPATPLEISNGKITICHATSSEANPYNEINISVNGLNGHGKHEGDIIPAPEEGCPATPMQINDGKITICHATGSKSNPYNEISISVNGLNGHGKHEGDIIPAPEEGCPISKP